MEFNILWRDWCCIFGEELHKHVIEINIMQLLLHEFKNNRSSSFVSDLSRETSEIFKEHLLNSKSDKETVSRTIYDYRNLWPLRHFQSLTERTFNNLNLLSKSHRHWHFIQKWRPRNRWVYIRKKKKRNPSDFSLASTSVLAWEPQTIFAY